MLGQRAALANKLQGAAPLTCTWRVTCSSPPYPPQVMGNSTAMWRSRYDLSLHSRAVQEAVDDSAKWRDHHLQAAKRRKLVIESEEED